MEYIKTKWVDGETVITADKLNKIEQGISDLVLSNNNQAIKSKNFAKKVCFYYGYPIAINGAWELNKAISIYKNYDLIVFGDEYNDTNHEDHANAVKIIEKLRTDYPEKEIFGYVPTAVQGGTKNLSTQEIKDRILLWHNMNVTGIFYDEFGFDYYNTRERQNELVNYGKSLGLTAFVNSWEDKYVFSTAPITIEWMPDFHPNPNGLAPVLDEKDYFLYENLFWDSSTGKLKAAKPWRIYNAYDYYNKVQDEYGMTYFQKFKCSSVMLDGILQSLPQEKKNQLRTISIIASKLLNIDGIAFGDEHWGSNGNFEEWELPTNLNFNEVDKHTVKSTMEGGFPAKYSATVNGQVLELVWKPSNEESEDVNDGTRTVSINGTLIDNCWVTLFDIVARLKALEASK